MRFLADAGISPTTVAFLRSIGYPADHVRDLDMQRATDMEIVNRAVADGAVVITFDLDFGEILALGVRDRPSVIILRLADQRAQHVNRQLGAVLKERQVEIDAGALILLEDSRYRLRKLPIGR
jgi:predicted nuclease of predicted toxin-antitoxin system